MTQHSDKPSDKLSDNPAEQPPADLPVAEHPTMTQRLVRLVIAVTVLVVGFGTFAYLVATRPQPKMVPRENLGELVEIMEVTPRKQVVEVEANGQVVPAQKVALSPEVGGRVVWLSKKLIPGGRFAAGEKIVRIDAREYNLAMQQQFAQVDRAQTELELEKSRKEIAEREWQLMGGGNEAGGLALRDPQMRTAQAALKAARSGLSRAKLSVDKTLLRAPFNAMVHSKSVDQGQLVGPASPLATLVGTDAFWVEVSIPLDRLSWIQVPGVDGATEGSFVELTQRLGEDTIVRSGKVVRLMPNLDPMGRMARVLVEIPDPLGLNEPAAGDAEDAVDGDAEDAVDGDAEAAEEDKKDLPLLIGSYVTVAIEGREVEGVAEVPREAVHSGDQVYVVADDNTLDIREVQIVWRRRDSVLVGSGLRAGDKVVTSPLSAAVQGMKLRIATSGQGSSSAAIEPKR